jgi:sporulation protein YqfC
MLLRLGLPIEDTIGLKITICDFKGILIEGHKGLLLYSPNKILLRVNKKVLQLDGFNFFINEVSLDELYIRGRISKFEVLDD